MKINTILMASLITVGIASCKGGNADECHIPESALEECMYSGGETAFSLWSPDAEAVQLKIYKYHDSETASKIVNMDKSECGLWKTVVREDLKNKYYVFQVKKNGLWLDETAGIAAKAVGVNGMRGAVIDWKDTDPAGWDEDKSPKVRRSEAIVYELHYRDFTIDGSAGNKYPGKFLSLTQEGTESPDGLATGIDHLKELGVTYVQLLPSTDFAAIDETRLDENTYNWGYEPMNYNAVEGSYSTNPYNPVTRIREFKEMVMALHKAGIRVILDVVYNHTTNTAVTGFERTMPGYFYRMNGDGTFANASGCGNETASERPMFRKYMIESLEWWMKEYHIDGFRFDLMAIHDIATMNEISGRLHEIDPDVLLYGEGWAASTPAYPGDSLAFKSSTYRLDGIGAFSDNMRDALRGPLDCSNAGFMGGVEGNKDNLQFGIAGGVRHPQVGVEAWCASPLQHISYVSCHDDHCLRDRLNEAVNATDKQKIRMIKLAQTAVYTSQGIPFIFNGEELFRHKQGVKNSYNRPDSINAIDWTYKKKYHDLTAYYAALAQIRKAHPGFCLGSAEAVCRHLEFIDTGDELVSAFIIKDLEGIDEADALVVVLNATKKRVKIEIPEGKYMVLAKDGKADVEGLDAFTGDTAVAAPVSATVLARHQ